MAPDLLEGPVARLQALHKPPPPWAFVARHLVALLKRYSTGLSFEVAADELASAWRAQVSLSASPPRIHTGTITHVAPGPPELWLVRLTDATLVAWYAHSRFAGRIRQGAVVSFAAGDVISPNNAPELLRLAHRSFHDAPVAGGGPGGAAAAAIKPNHTTPTKYAHEESNSQSPVDVTKFSGRNEQLAATPSQLVDPGDPTTGLKRLLLPSAHLFFDLGSVDHAALGLLEPPEAFSLQRIWNERNLTPNWIFAVVVQVRDLPNCVVRLQDPPSDDASDQPSVLWMLPQELEVLSAILKPGFHVLLQNSVVQPSDTSFDVFCSPDTICFYQSKSKINLCQSPDERDCVDRTLGSFRPSKRRRVDPDLSKHASVVDTKLLATLVDPSSQPELVVQSRVVAAPQVEEPYLTVVPCQHDVHVRIVGSEIARKAAAVKVGDEILFQDMSWAPPSASLGSQTPGGWIAGSVENLSIMSGFLQSAFVRRLTPLKNCFTLHSILQESVQSSLCPTTIHVYVQIRKVTLSLTKREILLSVSDNCPSAGFRTEDLHQADFQTAAKVSNMNMSREKHSVDVLITDIAVRDRCFEELFRTPNPDMFWNGSPEERIGECIPRLKAETWLMTLTCGASSKLCIPELRACAPVAAN